MTVDSTAGLMRDLALSGVYTASATQRATIPGVAAKLDSALFQVNLDKIVNKAGLLAAVGKGLEFPAWYGQNLDALADCLLDMAWRPADLYIVLLEGCSSLGASAQADFRAVLEVFSAAAGEWRARGIPLWCLIDSPIKGIRSLPVKV